MWEFLGIASDMTRFKFLNFYEKIKGVTCPNLNNGWSYPVVYFTDGQKNYVLTWFSWFNIKS